MGGGGFSPVRGGGSVSRWGGGSVRWGGVSQLGGGSAKIGQQNEYSLPGGRYGMPLAFTQEDFLVTLLWFLHTPIPQGGKKNKKFTKTGISQQPLVGSL